MIKGLDDDEVNFLDQVDKSRVEAERRKAAEDKEAMDEYRNAVSSLQEDSVQSRINIEVIKKPGLSSSSGTASKTSQHKLLAGAVKRKSSDVPKSAGDQNGAKRQHNETGMSLKTGEITELIFYNYVS